MQDIAKHPLLSSFWRREGTMLADNHSLTEGDTEYTIRIDDSPRRITLVERDHCAYTSIATIQATFQGSWDPLCLRPHKAVLILTGVNEKSERVERSLCVSTEDIAYSTAAYGREFAVTVVRVQYKRDGDENFRWLMRNEQGDFDGCEDEARAAVFETSRHAFVEMNHSGAFKNIWTNPNIQFVAERWRGD